MLNKGITKQELNDDILQELNKIGDLSKLKTISKNNAVESINEVKDNFNNIDEQLAEKTTQIEDIQIKNTEQDMQIDLLNFKNQVAGYARVNKTNGIFIDIVYYNKEQKRIAVSKLQSKNSEGKYTIQMLYIYKTPGSETPSETYKFNLEYDTDGDFIARRLVV